MHDWVLFASSVTAAVVGFVGVVTGLSAQRRLDEANRRHEAGLAALGARNDREMEVVRHELQQRLDDARSQREDERSAEQLAARYQEPLVRAAFDLQSRLWNILEDDLFGSYGTRGDDREREYARLSTQWLIAQYFGWVEILRRETQFLPHPDAMEQSIDQLLAHVSHVFSSDRPFPNRAFRIFKSEQRAIGELMIVSGRDAAGRERSDCLGYAEFVHRRSVPDRDLDGWLRPLAEDIEQVIATRERVARLVALQHALIDIVDQIDEGRRRFPDAQRGKASESALPTARQ